MKCTKNINGTEVSVNVTIEVFYKNCANRNLLCKSSDAAFLPAITVCNLSAIPIPPEEVPTARFTISDSTPFVDQTVIFTDTSTNHPTSWFWDFGDGNTSTEQDPSHLYSTADDYIVTLTATNPTGSSSPHSETINVFEPGTGTPFGILLAITR